MQTEQGYAQQQLLSPNIGGKNSRMPTAAYRLSIK